MESCTVEWGKAACSGDGPSPKELLGERGPSLVLDYSAARKPGWCSGPGGLRARSPFPHCRLELCHVFPQVRKLKLRMRTPRHTRINCISCCWARPALGDDVIFSNASLLRRKVPAALMVNLKMTLHCLLQPSWDSLSVELLGFPSITFLSGL